VRRILRPLAPLAAAALLLSACGADDPSSTAAPDAAAGATDHADHLDAADHDDPHADHSPEEHAEALAEEGGLRSQTTEETIAQMMAMDPTRLASLHDHSDAEREHAEHGHTAHPNGIAPSRVVIPAIGVDADVIELGLEANGEMEVPTDYAQTGWFRHGPRPGRVGPAVIAGHVDDRSGPAVFYRLRELSPGDEIQVHGDDGEVVTFTVRELEQHPKNDFPTERVYAGTPGSELRLVTCGGEFDGAERSYRDNVIVWAERSDL